MQYTGSERLPEVRERIAMAHLDELALDAPHTEATPPEPGRFEFARRLARGPLVLLDLLQGIDNVRVGAEAGQHFDERTEPAARGVEDPVVPLWIVPAVAEGSIASCVRPIGEGPGVGATADAVQRALGRDRVEPGTPRGVVRLSHR